MEPSLTHYQARRVYNTKVQQRQTRNGRAALAIKNTLGRSYSVVERFARTKPHCDASRRQFSCSNLSATHTLSDPLEVTASQGKDTDESPFILTSCRFVGLIISPVADCNLREYLSPESIPLEDRKHIRSLYGCLAAAVEYVHENNIRHGDIKPSVGTSVPNLCLSIAP
jgi:hypothetical protein